MSEGELKKRIDAELEPIATYFKLLSEKIGNKPNFPRQKHICDILDEAKKEFPLFTDGYINDICYSCKTEKSCPPCYKYEEWFKKYFGESI
jgi:hypothetical protein